MKMRYYGQLHDSSLEKRIDELSSLLDGEFIDRRTEGFSNGRVIKCWFTIRPMCCLMSLPMGWT